MTRIITYLFIFCCAFSLNAQQGFQIRVDTNSVLIGQPIRVDIFSNLSQDLDFEWPNISDSLGPLEVLKKSPVDTIDTLGQWLVYQSILVTQFDSGYYKIPAQKLKYKDSDGLEDSFLTNSIAVIYNTVAVDSTKAYYDIKQPMSVEYYYVREIIYIVIGLVLLALIAFLFVRYWPSSKTEEKQEEVQVLIEVQTLRALSRLRKEKAWVSWSQKDFYVELTTILRKYLEGRYGILAMEATTEEISEALNTKFIDIQNKAQLVSLLNDSDLVKFAKGSMQESAGEAAVNFGFMFVEGTSLTNEDTAMPDALEKKDLEEKNPGDVS